ncbi:MAG TPA: diguanylate cyclase [Tepidiformaceae bacterium]|nr:diguanylate cyclase [Tepidiformaceae bacterium]
MAKLLPAPEARASIRVLVIDDAVDDVKRVRDLLHREGDFRVQSARDIGEARKLLDEGNHDVALIDYRLWSDDTGGLVRFVRERHSDVAVVLLVSGDNEREALPALKLGAHDFLSKQHVDSQLAARIIAAVDEARSLRRRDTMVRWLEREARTDHLTGLFNRRAFDEKLHDVCESARRTASSVAVVVVDIAGTRIVNEVHGHEAGDAMIRRAAAGVLRSIRGGDFAARVGGDDFGIILPDAELETGRQIARRIAHEIERLNAGEWSEQLPIAVTFGVASGVGCEPVDLFAAADQQVSSYRPDRPLVAAIFRESEDTDGPYVA